MKKILIIVPAGAVARDFFECSLIAEIKKNKNLSIEVWCHENVLDYVRSNYTDYNLIIDVLPYAPLNWFIIKLLSLRHFFTRRKIVLGIKTVFTVEKLLARNEALKKKLISTKPNLIIYPTPRFINYEVKLGIIAKKLSIKLLCIVSSWDNMSKNPLLLRFDNLFVWNRQMKAWAVERHFYNEKQISVVGALQFDPHFRRIFETVSTGTHKEGKTINLVYATMGLLNWNFKEDEFVLYLYKIIRSLNPKNKIKLILRLHPHDQTRFQNIFNNMEGVEIHSNKMKFNPANRSGDWYMNKDDIEDIQELLMNTDIMLNMGTTLHIESVIFNVPSYIVNFHPTNDEYVKTNLKKIAFDKHFSPLIAKGLINFISGEKELIEILERISNGDKLNITDRDALIKEVVEYSDGRTAKRISGGVANFVEEQSV